MSSTRREFLKTTSVVAAGAALTGSAAAGSAAAGNAQIKNFNPKMGYRRLGKTEIMISEVSLGGHGSTGLQNRVDVLTRAAELGVNYFDTNIVEECAEYGKALRGRRDHWTIGFASWPQKITTEYEDQLSRDGMIRQIEARLKDYQTDMLDIWRPVGATWGEGQTKMPTMLMVSRKTLDLVAEAFEIVHRQGKVRFLGISAHNPKVFHRVLNEYPQFSVIIFPYLFLTKPFGGDSLLALAKTKDVGVIGLKPFGAGTTFGIKPREIKGDVDPRASVLLKKMLAEPRLSAVIPGVNTPEQLAENVKASHQRGEPLSDADVQAISECRENFYTNITHEYRWLHYWERA
jgi:aryl-alcohol dehydrogenase-like predicted oxidoreductase